ncbi:hypothetical protein M9458_005555, partial [Cirrhinus mrigala]
AQRRDGHQAVTSRRRPVMPHLWKHRFCKVCLESLWNGGGSCECPLCCQPSSMGELIVNTMLEKTCEGFLERCKNDPLACKEHGETLSLFCLEDLEPTCSKC